MSKRKTNLTNAEGAVLAVFNQTCHSYGTTVVTVKLHPSLTLSGTESIALQAQGMFEAVISVAASDPDGTEIHEFHGKSAVGCIPDGTGIALIRSPGGDLGTLLIVIAKGTVTS